MASLTHDEAVARAAAIRVDSYLLDFDLTRGDRIYRAASTISYTGGSTFVDVIPDRLISVTLDGNPLDVTVEDGRIALAAEPGPHVVTVVAEFAYTNTGQYMHRFIDPADGRTYVYAAMSLEAGGAVYACFDQPDLKAAYTVAMTVDPTWVAVANGAGTQIRPGRWEFATTKPLATYFTTVVAGPYHRIDAHHDGIPIALYARVSLAAHLEAQAPEIFRITAACFDRLHEMFGFRYPFGKYDQVFVPELIWGAMENAGCVNFRDEFIFTSAVTDAQREQRAIVIAHEMAHMWFGDLVTMRWWDDLWLNESFADYLGHRVTDDLGEFSDVWTGFAISRKTWGYAADQRITSHPVAPRDIGDTAEAVLNFDGISYAKGTSVLRQLVTRLGDEVFFAGLRAHIADHAYRNATLSDLLSALSTACGRDLDEWARVWLRTAGVSTLRPEITIDKDSRYASVAIVQAGQVLRPHTIGVAVLPSERTMVEVDGERTDVEALVGRDAGDLLLLNDGDLTYAKIRFDERSRSRLATTLPTVADPLTRALLWGAAWDETRDAEVSPATFIDLCAAALPTETNVAIFGQVIDDALGDAVGRYLPDDARHDARRRLAGACRTALEAAPPNSGLQLTAARALIRCADDADAGWLRSWLDDSTAAPEGLAIDAELRWSLLASLAAYGCIDEGDIEAEYQRDRTGTSLAQAAGCRALLPDADAKAAAWNRLVDDSTASSKVLFAIANAFWHPDHASLTAPYVVRYVTDMPPMARRRPSQLAERVAERAFPDTAVSAETLGLMTTLAERDDLTTALRRALANATDDLRRSLAARAASLQA